jgi:hypothetical protein
MDPSEDVLQSNAMVTKYNQELIQGLIRVIGATVPTVDLIGEKILADAIIELVQLRRTNRTLRGEAPQADYVGDEEASKPLVQALISVKHTSLP